ncbi:MAG: SDR family oxidoreductase [Bacteroidetes bacterium]|nr:SDR family oxidoreductase [Rhodothermia bacterium]MCS7154503.1 SDR family oxidoreductase [Bacteroidota bacterium]MCX7906876.1 SDR family oxidoreductase [Bacteroidota bacterium]MDW8136845.1 SDR family NAD(P)-dependent oxidoreductase [Bacteroidota bacterium]MDW8285285.1 SDR family NAD(P)-dependent oxidoreductase [Bacteroidota bacterium]
MIDLSGKVVLVTGASRGIGAGIARVLARAGAELVLHYGRSHDQAQALAREIGPERVRLVSADLAQPKAALRLWRRALSWRGRIDVLVNNAGVALAASPQADWERWRRVWEETLRVNLLASAHLCREAIAHFRTRGGGVIINIASRAAFRGDTPEYLAYAASKAGLVALTRSIARGYGRDNITAFVVAPGFVRTDMAEAFIQRYGMDYVTHDIPLGQMAEPEDIGYVVAFLASGLARHATGATIDVNGASYVR